MESIETWLIQAHEQHCQGNLREAEGLYRQVLKNQPDHVDALYLLGTIQYDFQRFDSAIVLLRRATKLRPNHAAAHNNLALALQKKGKLEEAIEEYRLALQVGPDRADMLCNLGNALKERGDLQEAVASYHRSLEIDPNYLKAQENLAVVFWELGLFEEGLKRCDQVLQIDANSAIAHNTRGAILNVQAKYQEAAASFEQAVLAKPDFDHALANLAGLRNLLGNSESARQCYRQLARRQPDKPLWKFQADFLCPSIFFRTEEIDRFREEMIEKLDSAIQSEPKLTPEEIQQADFRPSFNLQFHGKDDRPIRERFNRLIDPAMPKTPHAVGTGTPKVGFVVTKAQEGMFCKLLGGVLDCFGSGEFEIKILCTAVGQRLIRSRIKDPKVGYVILPPTFQKAVATIQEEGFDVLYHWIVGVEILGYLLPFCRLAPVQCTSWGMQVTSGISAMDYYISSELIETEESNSHYSEKLLLSKTLLDFPSRLPRPDKPRDREFLGLPKDRHLYLCAQQIGKFHPDFDEILKNILLSDPKGELVITRGKEPESVERLQERFRLRIPEVMNRIRFIPNQYGEDYPSLILQADVLLDPIHFGGVNTTYDGLALGKPIVTMPSRFQRGRYTLGCYRRMGVMDCLASSAEEYVRLAVRIACERDFREETERKITESSEVLFENRQAAGELEGFLIMMIQESRERNLAS